MQCRDSSIHKFKHKIHKNYLQIKKPCENYSSQVRLAVQGLSVANIQ